VIILSSLSSFSLRMLI